jgi:hypothetical protein
MKKLLIILAFLYSCSNNSNQPPPQKQQARSFYAPVSSNYKTVPKNGDGGWYYTKTKFPAKPGDTIQLEGDYAYINLDSVVGTPEKPIVFIAKGKVRIGMNNSYSLIMTNSHYIVWDGVTPGDKYSFFSGGPSKDKLSTQGFGFATSDNLEVKGMEIRWAQVGFFAAPHTGGNYKNIKIHDCYIHDLDNPTEAGRSEAFYIGWTSPATTSGGFNFANIDIYNNILDSLAGDGVQIALADGGVHVHENKISNYGMANLEQQRTAIIVGGCTNGVYENNTITNGTGAAFQCFGGGDVYFKNNTAENVASTATEDGFYLAGLCKDGALRVHLSGNKITGKVARDYVRKGNDNTTVIDEGGNQFGNVPPPPPVKTLLLTIHVYSDKTVSTAKAVNTKKTLVTNIKVYSDGSIEK